MEITSKSYLSSLSSANENLGTSPGSPTPVHVSVPTETLKIWKPGTILKTNTVWLSEGPLKGDISSDCIKKLYDPLEIDVIGDVFVGLPGVGSWRIVLPMLQNMGVKHVNMCFDGDVVRNPDVAMHLKACMKQLQADGYSCDLVIWNESDGKGIDDLLLNCRIPHMKRMF